MKHTIRILAVLAATQLLLVVIAHMGGSNLSGQSASSQLLGFDKARVDRLLIQGRDEARVELSKVDGQWRTPTGFPANQNKVDRLIDKLHDLRHGLPVATSASALQRFKVAEDGFEHKIVLQTGDDTLASLYLGSGAGARQTHARGGDDSAVYTVALGGYDAPATVDDWQDKTLLQLDKDDITAIELAGWQLQRDAGGDTNDAMPVWKADVLEAGKLLNQKAINDSLASLASLQFSKVPGKEVQPEYGMDTPALEFSLMHKGGQRGYRFGKHKEDDDYVLKVSDRPEYFQVAGYLAKPLVDGIRKEKWLLDAPKAETEAPATENAAPPEPALQQLAPEQETPTGSE